MQSCYICTYKTPILNKNKLIYESQQITNKFNEKDINKVINYTLDFKKIFINNQIEKKLNFDKILNYINILNINPNDLIDSNRNNIYHTIIKLFKYTNDNYYINLYNKLCNVYKDENKKNDANMIPLDYKLFVNYLDF